MAMNLSGLKPPAGQKRNKKRIGRGMGSGHGKTAGRGMKGQHAISGFSQKRGFEGGQMPLHRRLPKRGFNNVFGTEYATINVGRLSKLEGDRFDPESLQASGAVKKLLDGVKILGDGEIDRAIHVKVHQVSKTARQKIEAAGGTVELIGAAPATARD
jgi:large subunit ribosomal protein L15